MNDIIYKVSYQEEYSMLLEDQPVDHSIPLWRINNTYQFMIPGEYIKYLFFNILFNQLFDNSVDEFLNFHYENYTGDKSDFLRIFKLDIDEIYDSFEKPSREKKVLSVNPITGRTLKDFSKIIITDVLPFFQPYNFNKYLKYKRRYKESKFWIKSKRNELRDSQKSTAKKEYDSLVRARAFYIKQMQDTHIINFYDTEKQNFNKDGMIEYIERRWMNQSGKTVYEAFLKINARPDDMLKKYKKDHDYGMKLVD